MTLLLDILEADPTRQTQIYIASKLTEIIEKFSEEDTSTTLSKKPSSSSSSKVLVEKPLQASAKDQDKQPEDVNSQLKKQVSDLETSNAELRSKFSQLEADNADLKSQLSQLLAHTHSQKSSSSVDGEWTLLNYPSGSSLTLGPREIEVDLSGVTVPPAEEAEL